MKITIEISDNLFKKDVSNKFQDFFERAIADMADSLSGWSPKWWENSIKALDEEIYGAKMDLKDGEIK